MSKTGQNILSQYELGKHNYFVEGALYEELEMKAGITADDLEVGIPLPKRQRGMSLPLGDMKIGNSFFMVAADAEDRIRLVGRLRTRVHRYTKANPTYHFSIHTVDDDPRGLGARVFRVKE